MKVTKFSQLPQHHAVLLTSGERDAVGVTLFDELQSLSPVHRFFNQTVLDIDTARSIISWANTPYNDEKIGLISFHTGTVQAQNALLKVLEEPRMGVRFIILTSNKEQLLPTVLSRLQLVKSVVPDGAEAVSETTVLKKEATTFLRASYTDRIKLPFVTSLLAQVDEEKRKDREAVRSFILALAEALSNLHYEPKFVLETFEIASYASDPSASGKALLEYLALLLPQAKA